MSAAERARHIGWDIGIDGVAEQLGAMLDATTVAQVYSRLVIDCNRAPGSLGSIVKASDGTPVPGNVALTPEAVAARVSSIHAPYQAAVAAALDRIGEGAVLVALHSFTPAMAGIARPWHAGVLHMGDSDFARAMLAALRAEPDLVVGDNQPYAMDGTDYTVPHHAGPRALPYVELEVRQDLITRAAGQAAWAQRLARLLPAALAEATRWTPYSTRSSSERSF